MLLSVIKDALPLYWGPLKPDAGHLKELSYIQFFRCELLV